MVSGDRRLAQDRDLSPTGMSTPLPNFTSASLPGTVDRGDARDRSTGMSISGMVVSIRLKAASTGSIALGAGTAVRVQSVGRVADDGTDGVPHGRAAVSALAASSAASGDWRSIAPRRCLPVCGTLIAPDLVGCTKRTCAAPCRSSIQPSSRRRPTIFARLVSTRHPRLCVYVGAKLPLVKVRTGWDAISGLAIFAL